MDPAVIGYGGAALLAVVAGLAVKRVAKNRLPPKPLDPANRALINTVIALGYDPAKCLIQLVQGKKAGIRLLTKDGRPLRFFRASEIKRKQNDPEFRRRFAVARSR